MAVTPPQIVEATDPVCEMILDATTARVALHRNGATYYFCSRRCASVFSRDPDSYVPRAERGGGA